MVLRDEVNAIGGFKNLPLLAKQVVEGFISGMHKSPFHGFSAEFAEHRIYNQGESTKHIDWKLFAKTDKLYTKRYDDETNLRCHLIIDNSSSMYYPKLQEQSLNNLNKIGFSCLASACLLHMLKKQRDAAGLSIYNTGCDYYSQEKGSERHFNMILSQLERTAKWSSNTNNKTNTYDNLHLIAEKLKRRSLVVLFTDLFQADVEGNNLFEALRHLKYNKHEVIVFHVTDKEKEIDFNFENTPKRFVDIETGEKLDLFADQVKDDYKLALETFSKNFKMKCGQHHIKYIPVDCRGQFEKVFSAFLVERLKIK